VWNDRRLARRAARGDQDAFAAIFQRYQRDLYRYCVAILGDRQDAQDALQNTMVKALRALPGERREIDLKPWLYRVAHNESIELRRRARPSEPLAEDLGAPIASLEETAAERGRLRDLLSDIGELSERHRGALVMRELGGLDFDQIGEALDTSPGAARQVLYEARRGLQQMSDGREMNCDAVTALLSDGDGRVARRRDVRAHLRDCSDCRGFADGIRDRSATLAGIAPLPAIAAAAIAKGALAGSTGGGAVAGPAGAAAGSAGGSSAAGGAGLAGGVAAKAASTGAILKSTAAIVAVVGASAVAVDHSHLFGGHSSGSGKNPPAVAAKPASAGAAEDPSGARPSDADSVSPARRYFRPSGTAEVGLKPASRAGRQASVGGANSQAPRPTPATAEVAASGAPEALPVETRPAAPQVESPAHPEHPAHPTAPKRSTHTSRPEHPAHPAHPSHPSHPSHPANPESKPAPGAESEAKPETPPPAKVEAAPEATGRPKATDEAASGEAATTESATPEAAEAIPPTSPSTEAPGQAKK
jgi:RNA polymerase sigma factor (sigma-70 family)